MAIMYQCDIVKHYGGRFGTLNSYDRSLPLGLLVFYSMNAESVDPDQISYCY